jgi:hypothetical protein
MALPSPLPLHPNITMLETFFLSEGRNKLMLHCGTMFKSFADHGDNPGQVKKHTLLVNVR